MLAEGLDGLAAYNEATGFRHRGDAEVGGAPGQHEGGSRTLVRRYERRV
jgi:hypothetical protein